jgi:hypothetical protein
MIHFVSAWKREMHETLAIEIVLFRYLKWNRRIKFVFFSVNDGHIMFWRTEGRSAHCYEIDRHCEFDSAMKICKFESLPTELWLLIFDYLSSFDLFKAFFFILKMNVFNKSFFLDLFCSMQKSCHILNWITFSSCLVTWFCYVESFLTIHVLL